MNSEKGKELRLGKYTLRRIISKFNGLAEKLGSFLLSGKMGTNFRYHEHSIYIRCWHCHSWGINLPGNMICGDCGSDDTTVYYPLKKE